MLVMKRKMMKCDENKINDISPSIPKALVEDEFVLL